MTDTTNSRPGKVLLVTNHKGGVGKTSNTMSLAAALAKRGRKCLLIDFDGEPTLSELLRAPTSEASPSAFEFITQSVDAPETYDPLDFVITPENSEVKLPEGLHLIPGSKRIENFHDWLLRNKFLVLQQVLKGPFETLREHYDYIFIDTPPRTSDATVAAMFVTDFVVLSTFPQPPSVRRLVSALEDLKRAKLQGGAPLEPIGILMCAVRQPPTRLTTFLTKRVIEAFTFEHDGSPMKFTEDVVNAVTFDEAWEMGKTIFEYAPDHQICHQYLAIADELEARIAARSNHELVPQARPELLSDLPDEVAANA